jgi:hypothetical protein
MHEGGCECGALRYRVTGEAVDSGYCHCRICQRTSGAPVQAFAGVHADQFAYIKGTPKIYFSSEHAQREFCPHCGSQILCRDRDAPFDLAFSTPTLDDPSAFPPRRHGFRRSRIAWFETADDLPRRD